MGPSVIVISLGLIRHDQEQLQVRSEVISYFHNIYYISPSSIGAVAKSFQTVFPREDIFIFQVNAQTENKRMLAQYLSFNQ